MEIENSSNTLVINRRKSKKRTKNHKTFESTENSCVNSCSVNENDDDKEDEKGDEEERKNIIGIDELEEKIKERLHIKKKNGVILMNGKHNDETTETTVINHKTIENDESFHKNDEFETKNSNSNSISIKSQNNHVENGCEIVSELPSSLSSSSSSSLTTSTASTTTTITTITTSEDENSSSTIPSKILPPPPPLPSASSQPPIIQYKEYESELQMPEIIRLIQKDLSEPYSIYTYRYFIHNWPQLCFLAMHENVCVGAIVCKLDMHGSNVKRGYIAMLAVDKDYRKLKIGTNLVQKAIQAMLNDNADEVVLETEITNTPALRLYENLGFVRDKRLFHYYLNGVDALRLKLWFR